GDPGQPQTSGPFVPCPPRFEMVRLRIERFGNGLHSGLAQGVHAWAAYPRDPERKNPPWPPLRKGGEATAAPRWFRHPAAQPACHGGDGGESTSAPPFFPPLTKGGPGGGPGVRATRAFTALTSLALIVAGLIDGSGARAAEPPATSVAEIQAKHDRAFIR